MTNTILIRWSISCWSIWYYDKNGRKHFNGTYNSPLSLYIDAATKNSDRAIVILPAA